MINAKHTPKPWKRINVCKTAINAGDKHICMVSYFNSIDSNTRVADEEHEANVCLIETAPDMLEMLVIARDELMSIARLQDWHSDEFRYKLDKLTTIIEKASGMEIEELTNEVQQKDSNSY